MNFSINGWILAAIAPCVSIVYFVLGKDLILPRRLLVSIHGLAAVAMFPFALAVATLYPESGAPFGFAGLFLLGGLSSVSIFFSIAELSVQWSYHLLHIPTVFVIALSFVISLFALGGH